MGTPQRLAAMTMTLQPEDGKELTHSQATSLGPYLQGALMEHIDPEYAAWLHVQPFNPYSQYCLLGADKKSLTWYVNTLTDEAFQEIILPLQRLQGLSIRATGLELSVDSFSVASKSQKDLTDLIYGAQERRIKVEFVTPTAFKRAGAYVFMPDVRSVFQNLLMRYYQVYEGSNEVEEETLQYLDQHIRILSYRLQSHYFEHVSCRARIPGFLGTVTLGLDGPQQVRGLAHMLVRFGEFSGVGIKTSMGMGGTRCL